MPDLSEFEFSDFASWEHQVLKGSKTKESLNDILLFDEVRQFPYVDSSSVNAGQLVQSYRNFYQNNSDTRQGARSWFNMELIPDGDSVDMNRLSLVALNSGADGIILNLHDRLDTNRLLKDIAIEACQLGFSGSLKNLQKIIQSLKSGSNLLQGYLALPLTTDLSEVSVDDLRSILSHDGSYKGLVIHEELPESGTLDEISLLLCKSIYILDTLSEQGIPVEQVAKNIQLNLTIGDSYLWEICRFRSLRILFHQIIQEFGLKHPAGDLRIHASTSTQVGKDERGPNVTIHPLIGSTTQAMSAILGGCNALTVTTATIDNKEARNARNVGLILKNESYFNKVSDPVAGSYYLEALTEKMLLRIWSRVQEIEKNGGYKYQSKR